MIIGVEIRRTVTDKYFIKVSDLDRAHRKLKEALNPPSSNVEDDLDLYFEDSYCAPAGCGRDDVSVEFDVFKTQLPDLVEATNSYWGDLFSDGKLEKISWEKLS